MLIIRMSPRRLEQILNLQARAPTDALSCNRWEGFAPRTFGWSDEDERTYRSYPELKLIEQEVRKVDRRGGRYRVSREGGWHVASGTQLCEFHVDDLFDNLESDIKRVRRKR